MRDLQPSYSPYGDHHLTQLSSQTDLHNFSIPHVSISYTQLTSNPDFRQDLVTFSWRVGCNLADRDVGLAPRHRTEFLCGLANFLLRIR